MEMDRLSWYFKVQFYVALAMMQKIIKHRFTYGLEKLVWNQGNILVDAKHGAIFG